MSADDPAVAASFGGRLTQSAVRAATVAIIAAVLSAAMSVVFWELQQPDADLKPEQQQSFRKYKESMYPEVFVRPFAYIFLLVSVAVFASTFPPKPARFTVSLGIMTVVAAIAYVLTMPMKFEGPNDLAVCASIVLTGAFVTQTGFRPGWE
ncbi:MAG: hypothetical protein JNL58_07925 [Planctomyces sp.]|nr:hypothetical protein [Planctomyces sp.]